MLSGCEYSGTGEVSDWLLRAEDYCGDDYWFGDWLVVGSADVCEAVCGLRGRCVCGVLMVVYWVRVRLRTVLVVWLSVLCCRLLRTWWNAVSVGVVVVGLLSVWVRLVVS